MWPIPKSVKEVRQFLRFAGYYRRFIKGFATIVRPLNTLLVGHDGHPKKKEKANQKKPTKKVPFKWQEDEQQSFEQIKEMLMKPPILGYADDNQPFKVHTDTCGSWLCAVLYQQQDGKDLVIAYASRSLKPAENNYPAHKLEFLAL